MDDGLACVVSMLDGAPRVGYVHMEMRGVSRGEFCLGACRLHLNLLAWLSKGHLLWGISLETHSLHFFFCLCCLRIPRSIYIYDGPSLLFFFLFFFSVPFGLFILYEGEVSLAGYAWICFGTVSWLGCMGRRLTELLLGKGRWDSGSSLSE
jgi:hypothetical protein